MRVFEIVLLLMVLVLPFLISTEKIKIPKKIILPIFIGLLVLHFFIEGYRWQMIPVYLLSLIVAFCVYKEYRFFSGKWYKRLLVGVFFGILLVLGFALPTILPVFKLPNPTGKYTVGSQYLHLKTDRVEDITPNTSDKRELMIKVWYPSTNSGEKEKYLTSADKEGFALKYGLPASAFNYLKYVNTHTYKDAKIANGKFPVLIFSHGYNSKANGYYALLEEVVSHGYIVLAINHTYESVGSLFPNNEIRYYDNDYNRKINNKEMASLAWEISEKYKNTPNWKERHNAIKNGIKNYSAAIINDRWSEDIVSVIENLENWNENTFLKNHLALQSIGVFGHSQGGAAAGESIIKSTSVKAAINLDGVQWGNMIDTTMHKPFALISSDWAKEHPNLNEHAYYNGSTKDFYNAKILSSGHSNFMDVPLMINLSAVNEAGSINPVKATKITTEFVVSFFDKYLLDKQIDVLKLSKKYNELEIKLEKQKH